MTKAELLMTARRMADHEINEDVFHAAVEAYSAALLQQASVSRSVYFFEYSSIGKDWNVSVIANNLNEAMVKFATTYHNVDVVHSITEAE